MKYWTTVIACFFAAQASAQQFVERVYLKDSVTFYEGYIIEQAPAKHVKIFRLKQKDTVQVELTDIWKITKLYDIQKKAMPVAQYPKRYYKSVFFELGGKALTYSVNYDMRTERGRRNGWGLTAGLSVLGKANIGSGTDSTQGIPVIIPFSINYLFGKKKDFFELGAGATYLLFLRTGSGGSNWADSRLNVIRNVVGSIFGTFTLAYRHMPLANGISWRMAINPLFFSNRQLYPWFGLSIGYQFW